MATDIDELQRVAREVQPDLWERTEQVARIIDPAAFAEGWTVTPETASKSFALRLKVSQANAMSKAHEVLRYLGVNVETDWFTILERLSR